MELEFEWDEIKAATNLRKHGLSFDEAGTVFFDPLAKIFDDPTHSKLERREIIIGHTQEDHLVIASFTERQPRVVRIFSARPVTKQERRNYEENIL